MQPASTGSLATSRSLSNWNTRKLSSIMRATCVSGGAATALDGRRQFADELLQHPAATDSAGHEPRSASCKVATLIIIEERSAADLLS